MNRIFKGFSCLLILLLLVSVVSPFTIYANGVSMENGNTYKVSLYGNLDSLNAEILYIGLNGDSDSHIFKDGRVIFDKDTGILSVGSQNSLYELLKIEDGKLIVNITAFKNARHGDVTKAIKIFVKALCKISYSEYQIDKLLKSIEKADTKVEEVVMPIRFTVTTEDVYMAYGIVNPFLGILNILLGVGAVVLIILSVTTTVIDLAYIGFPFWRGVETSQGIENKLISDTARKVVEEVEYSLPGTSEYKNAYILYLGRRAKVYILLAICIIYFLCGGINELISMIMDTVYYLLDAIGNAFS